MIQDNNTDDQSQWRRDYSSLLLEFLMHDRSQSYHSTSINILMNACHMEQDNRKKILLVKWLIC